MMLPVTETAAAEEIESAPNSPLPNEDDEAPSSSSSSSSASSKEKLKPSDKKALLELRLRLERAILGNQLLRQPYSENPPHKSPRRRPPLASKAASNSCPVDLSSNAAKSRDVSLWGVPLLPSRGHEGTDEILLKFLRARGFKVPDAFEMIRKTLRWRREFGIEGILEEDLGSPALESMAYMNSNGRKGHPLCYNIYGVFRDKDLFHNTFGDESKCDRFLRWRIQLMEKGVRNLSFKAGEAGSVIQIIDLKNLPGRAMKELQGATRKTLLLLQDNYPEFIAKHIFINVSFRYYAYYALFARFLTQRTKSKLIFARPAQVAETLLKFIAPENIPIQYGGLKRENDDEFSTENGGVSELVVRGGGIETIEIPIVEPKLTVVWDLTVVGWEVNYKEQFIPDDECSYTILIQKEKKLEESIRNSFYISEPGKVVLTIANRTLKKKNVLYRSKAKPTIPLYNFFK